MSRRIKIEAAPCLFQFYLDEILAIKADGNYSTVILADGEEFLVARQIGQIEKMIESQVTSEESCLAKVGRSLIINIDHVIKVETGGHSQVVLKSRHEKVSRVLNPPKDAVKHLYEFMSRKVS